MTRWLLRLLGLGEDPQVHAEQMADLRERRDEVMRRLDRTLAAREAYARADERERRQRAAR
jgi:hypothetical protein